MSIESTTDEQRDSVAVQRLVRRLVIGFRWQWRAGVIKRECWEWLDLIRDAVAHAAIAVLQMGLVIVWPLVLVWRFTGEVVWMSCVTESEVMDELETVRTRNRDSANAIAQPPAGDTPEISTPQ